MGFKYTGVYWDVGDWWPGDDTDPEIIYGRIGSALVHEGFRSEFQIRAYVDPNKLSAELVYEYKDAGFVVEVIKKSCRRVIRMLVSIVLWALNHPHPASLVVITKISQDTEMIIRVLFSLKQRGCNVILVLPDTSVPNGLPISHKKRGRRNRDVLQLPDHTEIPLWICPDLFERKPYFEVYAERYEQDYVYTEVIEELPEEDYEHPEEASEVDREESRVPQPFTFSMGSKSGGDVKTGVFWDVMDYPLPAHLDSCSFYDNIKSFLEGKGSHGDLFIWAYVPDDDVSLLPPNCRDLDSRFTLVPKVPRDKYARLDKMTFDLLLWAIDNPVQYHPCGPNLLVISKNNMELETKFYPVLRGFRSRRYTTFLALPDADVDKEEHDIVTSILPCSRLLSRGRA